MPRRSTDPGLSREDEELLRRLEAHGWSVIKVGVGNGEPAFAYSLGLYETFQHPELILFGLDLETMHQLINDAGDQIRKGRRYDDGQEYQGLASGYPVVFRAVMPERYSRHLTYTEWFYRGPNFTALQMVWPDANSRFPWEPAFDERYRPDQLVLYRVASQNG